MIWSHITPRRKKRGVFIAINTVLVEAIKEVVDIRSLVPLSLKRDDVLLQMFRFHVLQRRDVVIAGEVIQKIAELLFVVLHGSVGQISCLAIK